MPIVYRLLRSRSNGARSTYRFHHAAGPRQGGRAEPNQATCARGRARAPGGIDPAMVDCHQPATEGSRLPLRGDLSLIHIFFSDNYLTVFTPEGRAGVRRRRGGEAPTAWDGKNALNPGVWGEAPSQAKRLIPVGLDPYTFDKCYRSNCR